MSTPEQEPKDHLPDWLIKRAQAAWHDTKTQLRELDPASDRVLVRLAREVFPAIGINLLAEAINRPIAALILAFYDDACDQYAAFRRLVDALAVGQAIGETDPSLQDATLERALRVVLGNAGRALLRLGDVRNGIVFISEAPNGEACEIEIRHTGSRSLARSLGAAQDELDDLRAWVQGLRSDFVALTDNPADSARAHDWAWIDGHRPAPQAVESGEVAKRIHAADERALKAERAVEQVRQTLIDVQRQIITSWWAEAALSEGQASRLLCLDRLAARRLRDDLGVVESDHPRMVDGEVQELRHGLARLNRAVRHLLEGLDAPAADEHVWTERLGERVTALRIVSGGLPPDEAAKAPDDLRERLARSEAHVLGLETSLSLAQDRIVALKRDAVVPGSMCCAQCGFVLMRTTLYMKSGTSGPGGNETEPCPNGCGPLWPQTWKQAAQGGDEAITRQCDRAVAAETRVNELIDIMAEIPFGHDTSRVMTLRSQPETEIVAWVDRVHEIVKARNEERQRKFDDDNCHFVGPDNER
jgi:hypothetical protein